MFILGIIDLIWGVFVLTRQINQIVKRKKFLIIDFANLMVSFVYGFLPAVVLIRTTSENNFWKIDTTSNGIWVLGIATVLSVIVYCSLNLSYDVTKSARRMKPISDGKAVCAGLVMLAVGWMSLFLWTRADGGIMNFISHADGIRAGYYKLNNPVAFLEHFTRILLFAGCLLCSYWWQKKSVTVKCVFLLPAVAGVVGGFLFIMAWDSRVAFGFFVLMMILTNVDHRIARKEKVVKKEIIKLGVILVGVLLLIIASHSIMNMFRGITTESQSYDLFRIVEREFGFVLRTQQAVIPATVKEGFQLTIGYDLINAITAWIPSRFIPFDVPPSVWRYNTLFVAGTTAKGTVPSDLLSTSIHDLWYIGIVLLPMFYGSVIKKVDTWLDTKEYRLYNSSLKCVLCTVVIHSISHFAVGSLVSGAFYIVLGHVIAMACRALKW